MGFSGEENKILHFKFNVQSLSQNLQNLFLTWLSWKYPIFKECPKFKKLKIFESQNKKPSFESWLSVEKHRIFNIYIYCYVMVNLFQKKIN